MSEPIVLTSEGNKFQMARAVPGSFYEKGKGYCVNLDMLRPRDAVVACKLFPEVTVTHPELVELRDQLVQDIRPFDNATPYDSPINAPVVREKLREEDKELFRYQELDLGYIHDVLVEHHAAYIGWSRGMGKTIGAISLLEELDAQQVLVVCPNIAKTLVWEPDLNHYLSDQFTHIQVLPNTKSQRNKVLGWVREWTRDGVPFCLIVNYEQLKLIGDSRGEWAKYGHWDVVIADEAHRIKNPRAQMTRALKKVPTTHKLALSGSIISMHVEELFSPLQWMFPDMYRSKWRDWNDRYIDYVEGGFSRIPVGVKLDRLEALRQELGVFMVYRRKEDELDLPTRFPDEWRAVDLSKSQRKVYDDLAGMCLAELDSGEKIAAVDGLVMLTRLRQIATGLDIFNEDIQDSTKLDTALEIVQDNPEGTYVIFSWFKPAARAMLRRLEEAGITATLVDGDTSNANRTQRVQAFQNGDYQVFVGTIATMGETLNLQRANNAIFLDRSWNPKDNEQATDRIYRIGQEREVTVTHLYARDTVDETRVTPSIKNKEALRAMILGKGS